MDKVEELLEIAHSRGIITEWPPFLTRSAINRACLEYGEEGVVWFMRHEWKPEKPTINYCWVVSEVAYRLVMPRGTSVWQIEVEPGRFHWFLKDPEKHIVDLTLDQAEAWWAIPRYEEAKPYRFKPAMSDRCKKLAQLLGIIDKEGKGRK